MSIAEFKKLKRRIDKILVAAEDDALKDGVVITSEAFQELLTELKRKLAEEWGLSLEEYELMESGIIEPDDVVEDEIISLGEKTKIQAENRKKEFASKTEEIVKNFNESLQRLTSSFNNQIDAERKTKLTKKDIVDFVRPLIPQVPKHTDSDHQDILKSIKRFEEETKKLVKEINGLGIDDIKIDQLKLQEDFVDLYNKVGKIKVPNDYIRQSVLEPSIKELIAPELNRILRSVQSQVYMVDHNVKERVIRSGFYKLTVSATEPTNPETNDLWVDIS